MSLKIPIYERTRSLPDSAGGVPLNPSAFGRAGESIARFGDTLANFALQNAEQNIRMQREDEDNKIANLSTQFDATLINEHIEYNKLQGDKAYGSRERLDLFQKSQLKEITKDIENSRVVAGISSYIENKINSKRLSYASYEAGQRQVVSDTTRDMRLDSISEKAFNGVGEIEENLEDVRSFIKTQHDNGEISTDVAEAWLYDAERKVAERTVAGMVNRMPTAAIEIMNAGAFNKYLDSKTIEHYTNEARQEAGRQEKIQEAAIKEQKKALEDEANKEMTDALLDGKLNKELLGKNRDALSSGKYESWSEKYNTQIENLAKSVNEEKAQTLESELFVKGLDISTQKEFDVFEDEIALNVAKKKLTTQKARQLLNDATEIDKGNPERKAAITQSIDSIEVAYKNGILGDGMESTIEREKMIRDLRAWSIQNPDKDPVEFTEKVLTTKREHWIKSLFRQLPGVSAFMSFYPTTPQTPQEARLSLMQPQEKPVLPSKDELSLIVKEKTFTKQIEMTKYLQDIYGISQQEATNYLNQLK